MLPEFVIDDHSGIVMALGGVVVKPYYTRNPDDEEILRVYNELCGYKR